MRGKVLRVIAVPRGLSEGDHFRMTGSVPDRLPGWTPFYDQGYFVGVFPVISEEAHSTHVVGC